MQFLKNSMTSDNELTALCRPMLERWCDHSNMHIHRPFGSGELSVYGIGHNSWGVQTQQKAMAAYAVAGSAFSIPSYIKEALAMLEFNLESHIGGSRHCLDGTKWGHTWISCLGINRMIHGVLAIWDRLSDQNQRLFEHMMRSESDFLINDYVLKAGLYAKDGNNVPESNIWNGAQLFTTYSMFGSDQERLQYIDRAVDFFINGISVDSDAEDETVYEEKTVSDRYVGSNFFETYALNHHGYMNVGYMVICLSNIALTHFLCRSMNIQPPKWIYHHADECWKTVRQFIFSDGRLNRIGGDTRVRYCYCQDYIIPVLLMQCDRNKDPVAKRWLFKWIQQVKTEFDANDDGSFLSLRAKDLQSISPLYYTRLESDRAVSLSMAVCYASVVDDITQTKKMPRHRFQWHDPYHGATFVRDQNTVASFTWLAGERPQGMRLPTDGSDLAEWKESLSGRVLGIGKNNDRHVLWHATECFDRGFVTMGQTRVITSWMPEGSPKTEPVADITQFFLVLPDDATCVSIQYATSIHRKYVKEKKGGFLPIPNDCFNHFQRTYYSENRTWKMNSRYDEDQLIDTQSRYVNVDHRLSFICLTKGQTVSIIRPAKRQIAIKNSHFDNGFLYCDELVTQYDRNLRAYDDHEMILDTAILTIVGKDAPSISKWLAQNPPKVNHRMQGVYHMTLQDQLERKVQIAVNATDGEILYKNGRGKMQALSAHVHIEGLMDYKLSKETSCTRYFS